MTKTEEEVKKREAVSPDISQNLNKRANPSTDDVEAASFGATHKLKDQQVLISHLDSTYKSPVTYFDSGVVNVFVDCKAFQEKYKITGKLGEGGGGTVYAGNILFVCCFE